MTPKVTVIFLATADLDQDRSLAIIGSCESLGDWNTHAPVYAHLTTPVSREWMVKVEIERDLGFFWSWLIVNSRGQMERRESKPRRRFVQLGYEDMIIRADYNGQMELIRFVDTCLMSSINNQQNRGDSLYEMEHITPGHALNGVGDIGMDLKKLNHKETTDAACMKIQTYSTPRLHDYAIVPYVWPRPAPFLCWSFHTMVIPKLCVNNRLTGEVKFPSSSIHLWNMTVVNNEMAGNDATYVHTHDDRSDMCQTNSAGIFRQALVYLSTWMLKEHLYLFLLII